MHTLFNPHVRSWIARLASRVFPAAPAGADGEAGVLARPVRYEKILDDVGDDPAVSLPRRRHEDCRSYRFRLQVHLQEQVMLRERLDRLLEQLLASERS